eukprot:gene10904-biopygen3819
MRRGVSRVCVAASGSLDEGLATRGGAGHQEVAGRRRRGEESSIPRADPCRRAPADKHCVNHRWTNTPSIALLQSQSFNPRHSFNHQVRWLDKGAARGRAAGGRTEPRAVPGLLSQPSQLGGGGERHDAARRAPTALPPQCAQWRHNVSQQMCTIAAQRVTTKCGGRSASARPPARSPVADRHQRHRVLRRLQLALVDAPDLLHAHPRGQRGHQGAAPHALRGLGWGARRGGMLRASTDVREQLGISIGIMPAAQDLRRTTRRRRRECAPGAASSC